MKFRYRFKGKFADKTRKVVLERIDKNGRITGKTLPHPREMWDTQKCPDNSREKQDTKICELSEPKVHDETNKEN